MQTAGTIHTRPSLHQMIQASWQRCRQFGLGSHWHIEQHLLSSSELQDRQEQNRLLRRLALREMNLLEPTLRATHHIFVLADSSGVILDSQGDNTFLGRARTVSLTSGASWDESTIGTNAIGTAIINRHYVQVVGRQHFFDENCFLACHGMPVMSPKGRLAGVLDISGCVHESFTTAGRLVRQAAAHIEHDWVEETATDLIVRLHQHPSWLGTPEEGIMTFEEGLLTGANSQALHQLGLSPCAIQSISWGDIFHQKPIMGRMKLHHPGLPGIFYAQVSRTSSTCARISATESVHVGPESLADIRDEAFKRAMTAENGNLSAAAKRLGVHRSTLYRRANKKQTKTEQVQKPASA